MKYFTKHIYLCLLVGLALFGISACKNHDEKVKGNELPELNGLMRPYLTLTGSRVHAGPGDRFRVIANVPQNAKINLVAQEGDWGLIVSKKGNAPGFINMAAVEPATEGETEASTPTTQGRYEVVTNTQVRSGAGMHHSVVAEIKQGTKINVVEKENGWLKVESKHGNRPGYVDASLARPVEGQQ